VYSTSSGAEQTAYAPLSHISAFFFVNFLSVLYLSEATLPRLKTWTRPEGRIRLSEDEGPPAREFLEDDYEPEEDDDDEDDEPLAQRAERVRLGAAPLSGGNGEPENERVLDLRPSNARH